VHRVQAQQVGEGIGGGQFAAFHEGCNVLQLCARWDHGTLGSLKHEVVVDLGNLHAVLDLRLGELHERCVGRLLGGLVAAVHTAAV